MRRAGFGTGGHITVFAIELDFDGRVLNGMFAKRGLDAGLEGDQVRDGTQRTGHDVHGPWMGTRMY